MNLGSARNEQGAASNCLYISQGFMYNRLRRMLELFYGNADSSERMVVCKMGRGDGPFVPFSRKRKIAGAICPYPAWILRMEQIKIKTYDEQSPARY